MLSWAGHEEEARALQVWPLDEHNIATLDAVRPRGWEDPPPAAEYELTVLDARCAPVQMFLVVAPYSTILAASSPSIFA